MNILKKYANLLTDYCLDIQRGESLFINSSTLAEPLVSEVYEASIKAGAHVEVNLTMAGQAKTFLDHARSKHTFSDGAKAHFRINV